MSLNNNELSVIWYDFDKAMKIVIIVSLVIVTDSISKTTFPLSVCVLSTHIIMKQSYNTFNNFIAGLLYWMSMCR